MPTMIQDNGVLDLKFRSGDDFAFDVTFPFAVTESQAQAAIGNLNKISYPIVHASARY